MRTWCQLVTASQSQNLVTHSLGGGGGGGGGGGRLTLSDSTPAADLSVSSPPIPPTASSIACSACFISRVKEPVDLHV